MDWKNEIQTGPLAATLATPFAKGDDGTVAGLLNAKTVSVVRSISRHTFVKWAAKSGMRAIIQDEAANAASPLRSSALALLDIIQGGGTEGIDFSDVDNSNMLAAWVAFGKLSPVHRDELLALATILISRAEEASGQDATIADVSKTRGE